MTKRNNCNNNKADCSLRKKKNKYLLNYNLQFFAQDGPGGEKTEEASAKKISDARKEGQVAKSTELVSGVSLIGFFFLLKIFIGYISGNLIDSFHLFYRNFDVFSKEEVTIPVVNLIMREVFLISAKTALPIIGIIFILIILVNLLQVKLEITTKPLMPKLSNFSPISGFKRMFSKDKIVTLVKDVVKVILIIYIAYNTLISELSTWVNFYDMGFNQGIIYTGDLTIRLGINIGLMYLILGILDLVWQKFRLKRELRMTKQEVKDEFKQTEGNPQIKNRQKSKMREVSNQRMMRSVPEADVIITNPTHYAIAIKYDTEISDAPILIAKGADYLAKKIKEIAKDNKVPIVENKALARMLYSNVDIGEEITPELYEMTAQVLAYVYSLNKGGKL